MGLQDMLALMFGIRTANAVDEYREAKEVQKSLQAELASLKAEGARIQWLSEHRELWDRWRDERFAPPARSRALRAWSAIEPADRLRPSLRDGQPDGGKSAGADLEAVDLSDDVVHLYAADVAAGSPRRYVAALDDVDVEHDDEEIAAGHAEYDGWNRDLRRRYDRAVDDLFDAYNSVFLNYYNFHWIRLNMGLVSSDVGAQDDLAIDHDVFDSGSLSEADWQELFTRSAAQDHGGRP